MSTWDGRDEHYLILDDLTAPEGYGVGDKVRVPFKPLSQWSQSAQNAFNNSYPSQYAQGRNAAYTRPDALGRERCCGLRQAHGGPGCIGCPASFAPASLPMAWYLDQLGDA